MLTRIVPLARSVNSIARQQTVRCMGGVAPAHWKTEKEVAIDQKSSMNDLPVPEGSWQEQYNKRNATWNLHMVAAAIGLVVTGIVMNQMGCFYLHDIPPLPKKRKIKCVEE